MSNYSEGRTCAICGTPITDDNPDGIGWQCRAVYNKATWDIFFENQERRYQYYSYINEVYMEHFIKNFSNVKFRSSFRKAFYPSVVEQWNTKQFVSRRQREIILSMLMERDLVWNNYGLTVGGVCEYLIDAKNKQHELFENWRRTMSTEEAEHIHNLANKLRHDPEYSGRRSEHGA